MPVNLKGRSLDSALNFTTDEIKYLIDLSVSLKKSKYQGLHVNSRPLTGKNIVILFQKDSTRTMCAFQVAAADLGASCTYIGSAGSNFGKKESVEDTARVLGRFYDGIEFRCFRQTDVDKFVKYAGVPIWNGLSDQEHPTQMIADLMTMREHLGDLRNKKIVFAGDIKNNVAVSCLIGAAFCGMHIVMAGPAAYKEKINPEVLKKTAKLFELNGGSVTFETDKMKAAQNADVIYTDVWVSLGEDFKLFEPRISELRPFQVDMKMVKAANPNVIFMHCLPAFHDDQTEFSAIIKKEFGSKYPEVATGAMEVTNEVFESKYNKSFDQAENRMHSIKAIILSTLGY